MYNFSVLGSVQWSPPRYPLFSNRSSLRSLRVGSPWGRYKGRTTSAPYTVSGLTPFKWRRIRLQTLNTRNFCELQQVSHRRSGTTRISIIRNSPSLEFPGTKRNDIAIGLRQHTKSTIVFRAKRNGNAPLAVKLRAHGSLGATRRPNLFPTTPIDGKQGRNRSANQPQMISAFSISAPMSTSGAATGTIPPTTLCRRSAIRQDQNRASDAPRVEDPGDITSRSRAARPARAFHRNFNTRTTVSALPVTSSNPVAQVRVRSLGANLGSAAGFSRRSHGPAKIKLLLMICRWSGGRPRPPGLKM